MEVEVMFTRLAHEHLLLSPIDYSLLWKQSVQNCKQRADSAPSIVHTYIIFYDLI